ncbi:hypothetical protein [Stenotrophomonas sp.]|uniref:hypothetical protein n=1 Tax=Stenotrophomonas sp. TaxID=69392 RepID=UPI0028AC2160|nr:hypothetical protein [Stenotrophomonas sp.]
MSDIEKRARELLAAELRAKGLMTLADAVASGEEDDSSAIRAIIAALTPPEGYVLVPVKHGAMYVCPTCHGVGSVTQQVHDEMLAARPEVKP